MLMLTLMTCRRSTEAVTTTVALAGHTHEAPHGVTALKALVNKGKGI